VSGESDNQAAEGAEDRLVAGSPERWWSARTVGVVGGILLLVVIGCGVALWLMGSEWRDAMVLREAEGKGMRVDHFVKWGLWRAALIDAVLAVGLLVTMRWWWGRSKGDRVPVEKNNLSALQRKQWWIAVGLLVLLALGIRWARMDLSLYNDEVAGFSRYIAGSFKGGAFDLENEEPAKFVATTWLDTVWGNREANNHGFYSVLARLAYDSWQAVTDGVPGQVREIPLRLPALLGGLLGVFAVARLGRSLGFAAGGLFAALLVAVHPWHLRYSTEARGYGLLLGLAVLAAWCLVEALHEDDDKPPRWRWWLAYALCQAAYLWANLGGVYLAAGMNGLVLAGLAFCALRKSGAAGVFRSGGVRGLLVANVISAMVLVPLVLPCVPQITAAMERNDVFRAGLPFGVGRDVISNLLIGMPWFDGDPENPFNPAVIKYSSSPATWIGLVLSALVFLAGLTAMVRQSGRAALAVVGALVGLGLAFLNSVLTEATLLPWYVIFVLPFVVLCCGCGIASLAGWLGQRFGEAGSHRRLRYIGYAMVGLILWAGFPAVKAYRTIGKQALRDSIVEVRGAVYPFTEEQKQAIVVGWWTEAGIYDPRLRLVWKVEQLEWVIDKARSEKRPLFFILGKREAAMAENAAVVEMVEDAGLFEPVKIYPGLEQISYREHLYRLLDVPPREPTLAASG
jgi:uncharacterized membrane protein